MLQTCCGLIHLCLLLLLLLLLSHLISTFDLIAQVDGRKAEAVRWINRLLAGADKYSVFFKSKTQYFTSKDNQPEDFFLRILLGCALICFGFTFSSYFLLRLRPSALISSSSSSLSSSSSAAAASSSSLFAVRGAFLT